jgi:hypothetical protein
MMRLEKTRVYFILIFVTSLLGANFCLASVDVLWQIGQVDGSCGEFALAKQPNQFKEKFPGDVIYTVGESEPSQFPALQPNSADVSWGGRETIPFVIRFHLPQVVEKKAVLSISLADVHERLAPLMEVSLDGGQIYSQRIATGAGNAYSGSLRGIARKLYVEIPAGTLSAGNHELIITLKDGSWVAYDAIAMFSQDKTPVMLPDKMIQSEDKRQWLAIESFTSWEGIVLYSDEVIDAMLPQGGSVQSEAMVLPENYQATFLVYTESGRWMLNYTSPDSMRGAIWQLVGTSDKKGNTVQMQDTALSRTDGKPSLLETGWLRFEITDQAGVAVIKVTDEAGKSVTFESRHVAAPIGRLTWQADSDVEITIAAVSYNTLPKKIEKRDAEAGKIYKKPYADFNSKTGIVTLGNGRFELVVKTKEGLNPCEMRDVKTGRVYADADYVWPGGGFPQLLEEPWIMVGTLSRKLFVSLIIKEKPWTRPVLHVVLRNGWWIKMEWQPVSAATGSRRFRIGGGLRRGICVTIPYRIFY